MTPPDDLAKEAKSHSEKPESGRKHVDPARYQVSTLPAEVRSEYQKLPLHRLSEEELKPPPGYGGTTAAPTPLARQLRVWLPVGAAILLTLGLVGWRLSAKGSEAVRSANPPEPSATVAPQVQTKPEPATVPSSAPADTAALAPKSVVRTKSLPKKSKTSTPQEGSKPIPEKAVNDLFIDR
jgi:hypothetical protein